MVESRSTSELRKQASNLEWLDKKDVKQVVDHIKKLQTLPFDEAVQEINEKVESHLKQGEHADRVSAFAEFFSASNQNSFLPECIDSSIGKILGDAARKNVNYPQFLFPEDGGDTHLSPPGAEAFVSAYAIHVHDELWPVAAAAALAAADDWLATRPETAPMAVHLPEAEELQADNGMLKLQLPENPATLDSALQQVFRPLCVISSVLAAPVSPHAASYNANFAMYGEDFSLGVELDNSFFQKCNKMITESLAADVAAKARSAIQHIVDAEIASLERDVPQVRIAKGRRSGVLQAPVTKSTSDPASVLTHPEL